MSASLTVKSASVSEADDGSGWEMYPCLILIKLGYVWGGAVDSLISSRGPLPHAEQLFPEADLNRAHDGLNIPIVFVPLLPSESEVCEHAAPRVFSRDLKLVWPAQVSYGGMGRSEEER